MKFSVVMPFYNSEAFIKDAALSIINQTYDDIELIAVNDGSTDRSQEILESLNDPRIKIYYKQNGGYVSAVNYGLDNITGEYFLLIGSDDMLFNNILYQVASAINDSSPEMIVFKVVKNDLDNNNKRSCDPQTLFKKGVLFHGTYSKFYSQYQYEATFFACRDTAKVFKTSLLNNLRYFGKYGFDADGIFSLLFAHNCNSFAVIPYDGYLWNIHSNSLCGKKKTPNMKIDRLKNYIYFMKKIKKYSPDSFMYLDYYIPARGLEVINYLYSNSKMTIITHYFTIVNYYRRFRKMCSKNKLKCFKGKARIRSFFPLLYLLYKL